MIPWFLCCLASRSSSIEFITTSFDRPFSFSNYASQTRNTYVLQQPILLGELINSHNTSIWLIIIIIIKKSTNVAIICDWCLNLLAFTSIHTTERLPHILTTLQYKIHPKKCERLQNKEWYSTVKIIWLKPRCIYSLYWSETWNYFDSEQKTSLNCWTLLIIAAMLHYYKHVIQKMKTVTRSKIYPIFNFHM